MNRCICLFIYCTLGELLHHQPEEDICCNQFSSHCYNLLHHCRAGEKAKQGMTHQKRCTRGNKSELERPPKDRTALFTANNKIRRRLQMNAGRVTLWRDGNEAVLPRVLCFSEILEYSSSKKKLLVKLCAQAPLRLP